MIDKLLYGCGGLIAVVGFLGLCAGAIGEAPQTVDRMSYSPLFTSVGCLVVLCCLICGGILVFMGQNPDPKVLFFLVIIAAVLIVATMCVWPYAPPGWPGP